MVYGRRHQPFHDENRSLTRFNKSSYDTFRFFRQKYSLYLIFGISGSVISFLAPCLWFVLENYAFFKKMATAHSPELLLHLERESTWILIFFAVGISCTIGICTYLAYRITKNITSPFIKIEENLRKINHGSLSDKEITLKPEDDLYEFLDLYNYTYKTLRNRTEQELKLLESLNIDPQNKEAYMVWKSLMLGKKRSLNISESEQQTSSTQPLRLVS